MFTPYTLDQLVAFLAVVDEGSFSAAGRRLGRVQSAVSYGIAQLEQALGATLFDRRGRTPTLTEAGRLLAAEARLVLAQTRALSEAAARLQAGVEPELRVVVDPIYPQHRLADVCRAFQEAFPSTALRLETELLDDAVERVATGAADLGACNLLGEADDQLTVAHLGLVRLVPVCRHDHPLAAVSAPQPSEVLERSVQVVHSQRGAAPTDDQGVLASRTWRVTELAMKAALIRRGVGWGSLPSWLAIEGLDDGSLVELQPEAWPPGGHRIALRAVTRRDHELGRAGQWFRRQLMLEPGDGP
jgi:DNA-binding transcriptional LysR family regulator